MALILASCSRVETAGTDYYFDPVSGRDENNGRSPDLAFKHLKTITELTLKPGDRILLKSGEVFSEQLYISCKGDSAHPVIIGKYGGDTKPHIMGKGLYSQAVHVYNSENIILRDIEISNKGKEPVDGLNGVLVELKNYGTARNITIDNLYVHHVYGSLIKENGGGNAIRLLNCQDDGSDSISSRFDGLAVQNCHIRECRRNGIMMWGNWVRSKWNPSLNVVIRNNLIEGVPGDGIVPVGCESPLIEYNTMKDCPGILPPSEACDGIWPWSCDNAVIQYNIVSGHKSQVDGYGFDSDWNSTNSLFQYNVSYDNDGGFLLICNSGGWTPDWSIGNTGTRIRYNISINDGIRNYRVDNRKDYFSPVIHITGPTFNTAIEKNLFYVIRKEAPGIDRTLLSLTDWAGYADSTAFNDNYLFLEEKNVAVKPGRSTRNFFTNNRYTGDLSFYGEGFREYRGLFNRTFWYDKNDDNWDRLINFANGKTILFNGKETRILDIIGYTAEHANAVK